jgi:hypothetical protein
MSRLGLVVLAVVALCAASVRGASPPARQLWDDDDNYGYRRGYYRRGYPYRRYRRYPYRRYRRSGYGYGGWGYDAPNTEQEEGNLGGATAPGVDVVTPVYGEEQAATTNAGAMFGATGWDNADVDTDADTEVGTDVDAGGNRKLQDDWNDNMYYEGGNYGGYRGRDLQFTDWDNYDVDAGDRAAYMERVSYQTYGDNDWDRKLQLEEVGDIDADDDNMALFGAGAAEGTGAVNALDTATLSYDDGEWRRRNRRNRRRWRDASGNWHYD